jgi:Tfp pilus assembly protein PilF
MKGLITNDWDRDNLNFLLNSPQSVLDEWNAQCDPDDLEYAQELLDAYAEELRIQARDLKIEAEMALMFEYPDAGRVIAAIVDKK